MCCAMAPSSTRVAWVKITLAMGYGSARSIVRSSNLDARRVLERSVVGLYVAVGMSKRYRCVVCCCKVRYD